MKPFHTTIRVRFSETDALGHVNNVSYFIYLEEARINFLKSIGYDFNRRDQFVAVVSAGCDFKSQAYFDQDLLIETTVQKVGTKSFTLDQLISDLHTGALIAKGQSVCVILNEVKDQAIPVHPDFRSSLLAHKKGSNYSNVCP